MRKLLKKEGASYFRLPSVLRWFTASIGFHHIHHVCSRIPNYYLQRCYEENPQLQQVTQLTLVRSIKTLWLTLWDEDGRRLVRFRDLRTIRPLLEQELGEGRTIDPTKPDAVPGVWR